MISALGKNKERLRDGSVGVNRVMQCEWKDQEGHEEKMMSKQRLERRSHIYDGKTFHGRAGISSAKALGCQRISLFEEQQRGQHEISERESRGK